MIINIKLTVTSFKNKTKYRQLMKKNFPKSLKKIPNKKMKIVFQETKTHLS